MEMYHFVTRWRFKAPVESVWKQIEDIGSWPRWTKDFRQATIRGPSRAAQIGTIADYAVRGSLPYTLRFAMRVTALQPPRQMDLRSTGALVGTGRWVLQPEHAGTETAVTYYWDVATTNPLFNLASKLPFVRALMEKNHDAIMRRAGQGLKRILEGEAPEGERDGTTIMNAYESKAGA